MDNKYWLKSKTVLYNIATIAAIIVAALSAMGITPDGAVVGQAVSVIDKLAVVLTALSPVVNLYLRSKTTGGITFKTK